MPRRGERAGRNQPNRIKHMPNLFKLLPNPHLVAKNVVRARFLGLEIRRNVVKNEKIL